MELDGSDVVFGNGGDEGGMVVGCGGDPGGVIGNTVITVDEIKPWAGREAAEDMVRRVPRELELVPAHMWDFEFVGELKSLD